MSLRSGFVTIKYRKIILLPSGKLSVFVGSTPDTPLWAFVNFPFLYGTFCFFVFGQWAHFYAAGASGGGYLP